jgi:hypothetical protein
MWQHPDPSGSRAARQGRQGCGCAFVFSPTQFVDAWEPSCRWASDGQPLPCGRNKEWVRIAHICDPAAQFFSHAARATSRQGATKEWLVLVSETPSNRGVMGPLAHFLGNATDPGRPA